MAWEAVQDTAFHKGLLPKKSPLTTQQHKIELVQQLLLAIKLKQIPITALPVITKDEVQRMSILKKVTAVIVMGGIVYGVTAAGGIVAFGTAVLNPGWYVLSTAGTLVATAWATAWGALSTYLHYNTIYTSVKNGITSLNKMYCAPANWPNYEAWQKGKWLWYPCPSYFPCTDDCKTFFQTHKK